MHVELTDLFRCPVAHRDSWLVAAAHHTESRVIHDGVLGCPECGAEYVIAHGIARFDPHTSRRATAVAGIDPELPFRIAALLGATDGSATVALIGTSVMLARAIQSVVPVRCVVVDPPDEASASAALRAHDAPLAIVRSNGALPVAHGALHGVYAEIGDPAAYIAALRTGGRLVAPVRCEVPVGITELARDAQHWVGEKGASAVVSALVELKRR